MLDIFFANAGAAQNLRAADQDALVMNFERNLAAGDIAGDDEPLDLRAQVLAGAPLRLWLSDRPEDMCGLYWLAHWLHKWNVCTAEVCAVKLPWFAERPDGVVVIYAHWGELLPERELWQKYAAQAQNLPANFLLSCALDWQELQKQNAPLRVMLNGYLISVNGDFYINLFNK